MIRAEQEATMRQLWRLNKEGQLTLQPGVPITVAQADQAIRGNTTETTAATATETTAATG